MQGLEFGIDFTVALG
ncbi:MAG: hypothetical protein R3E08_09400 [Thiotrichaceae bacterium]